MGRLRRLYQAANLRYRRPEVHSIREAEIGQTLVEARRKFAVALAQVIVCGAPVIYMDETSLCNWSTRRYKVWMDPNAPFALEKHARRIKG